MKRVFFLAGVLPFACMVAAAGDWARPDLIAKVASGEIREARVSWWGFDAKNSTKYLKAAIASGGIEPCRIIAMRDCIFFK